MCVCWGETTLGGPALISFDFLPIKPHELQEDTRNSQRERTAIGLTPSSSLAAQLFSYHHTVALSLFVPRWFRVLCPTPSFSLLSIPEGLVKY